MESRTQTLNWKTEHKNIEEFDQKRTNKEETFHTIHWNIFIFPSYIFLIFVNFSAVLSDLSPWTSERRNVSHLNHGLSKLLKKDLRILCICPHQFRWLQVLCQKNLIWVQQTLCSQKILKVVVVELGRAHKVQEKQVLVTPWSRASLAQFSGIWWIEGGIGLGIARLVVETLPEAGASGISNGVASCNHTRLNENWDHRCYKSLPHCFKSQFLLDARGKMWEVIPERATRSTISRPCLLNLVRMVWKVLFGAGMSLLEPLRLAPLESLLPSGTSQLGPPVFCTKKLSQTNTQSQLKEIYYAKKKQRERDKERKKEGLLWLWSL